MILKIAVSAICAILLGVHLLVPALKLDAVSLGLLAIALLPWFQSLLKSLELPGGLKIELQDVKAATDKVSAGAVESAQSVSATDEPGNEGAPSFIAKVAEQDPNLALVGLRIEVERRLLEIAEAVGLQIERRSAAALLRELTQREVIPQVVAAGLAELIALGNRAAHGAEVSKEAAAWALDLAPQILGALATIRPKSLVTLKGEIAKSEALGAFKQATTIRVNFPRPFLATPQVSVGFESSVSSMDSGAVQRTAEDERGFEFKVVALPDNYQVAIWSLKWSASGQVS